MASKLEGTWRSQHKEAGYRVSDENPDKLIFTGIKGREFERPDYSKPEENTRKVDIRHKDETFTRYIPEPVMQIFEKESEYHDYSDTIAFMNLSCFFFAVAQGIMAMMNTPDIVREAVEEHPTMIFREAGTNWRKRCYGL